MFTESLSNIYAKPQKKRNAVHNLYDQRTAYSFLLEHVFLCSCCPVKLLATMQLRPWTTPMHFERPAEVLLAIDGRRIWIKIFQIWLERTVIWGSIFAWYQWCPYLVVSVASSFVVASVKCCSGRDSDPSVLGQEARIRRRLGECGDHGEEFIAAPVWQWWVKLLVSICFKIARRQRSFNLKLLNFENLFFNRCPPSVPSARWRFRRLRWLRLRGMRRMRRVRRLRLWRLWLRWLRGPPDQSDPKWQFEGSISLNQRLHGCWCWYCL